MTDIPINPQWFAVLWSPRQDGFHVETLDEMFRTNARIFLERNLGDYILMSIAKTRDEAQRDLESLREARKDADRLREGTATNDKPE